MSTLKREKRKSKPTLPSGPPGPAGISGPPGPPGPAGTLDDDTKQLLRELIELQRSTLAVLQNWDSSCRFPGA